MIREIYSIEMWNLNLISYPVDPSAPGLPYDLWFIRINLTKHPFEPVKAQIGLRLFKRQRIGRVQGFTACQTLKYLNRQPGCKFAIFASFLLFHARRDRTARGNPFLQIHCLGISLQRASCQRFSLLHGLDGFKQCTARLILLDS